MPTKFSWVACSDPVDGTDRMTTWIGATRQVVVTGLPSGFAANVHGTFDLPTGSEVYDVPLHSDGAALARKLHGVLFTVFSRAAPGPPPGRR